jgi:hypothetical protein
MATALVQLDNGIERSCRGWSTLAGSAVTQLVITASGGSAQAAADAKLLHHHTVVALRRNGAQSEPTRCGDTFGPGAEGCWATSHPGPVRRILVWVADTAVSPPAVDIVSPRSPGWSTVLPLLPYGVAAHQLPIVARTQTAGFYTPGHIEPAVADVLVSAGLGIDAFRVFISYRRNDCATFAEQLFDALSRELFDVYLDRFRTLPGSNFVERIRSELADKACVVLLDSRDVVLSPWVEGEYAFARLYKLGLMAIDLPGGLRHFHRIGTRLDLRRGKRAANFNASSALSAKAVGRAVAFVRQHYFSEIARRFRHQRQLVQSSAALAGIVARLRPDGLFDVSGGANYVVSASARPPDVASFRLACDAAATSGGSVKGIIVGPLFAQMHQMREDTRWLARTSGSVAVDERRLLKAMRRAATGRL